MKAISIRQPWCWLILHASKDVENRTWSASYRGPVLIHASKSDKQEDWDDAIDFVDDAFPLDAEGRLRRRAQAHGEAKRGGIVGVAEIVDCVRESASPWFFGPRAFVLADRRPCPLIPFSGARGLFEVPDEIAARAVAAADAWAARAA
jgi:hypothetical protein